MLSVYRLLSSIRGRSSLIDLSVSPFDKNREGMRARLYLLLDSSTDLNFFSL